MRAIDAATGNLDEAPRWESGNRSCLRHFSIGDGRGDEVHVEFRRWDDAYGLYQPMSLVKSDRAGIESTSLPRPHSGSGIVTIKLV